MSDALERRRGAAYVIGTGKTALDIGLFLRSQGHRVTWFTRSRERLDSFAPSLSRKMARTADPRAHDAPTDIRTHLSLLDSPPDAVADIIIESTSEDIDIKRAAFRCLEGCISPSTLVASNSSSILPSDIHPRCIGLHFFYPLSLTRFVELILTESARRDDKHPVFPLVDAWGLQRIIQTENNAFAVNRLLLAPMAEAFRRMQKGHSPVEVDALSCFELLPFGLVGMMDSIGYDVLEASVAEYLRRMSPTRAADYLVYSEGLKTLSRLGIRGKKNRTPLLNASSNPWCPAASTPTESVGDSLRLLFVNTCFRFVENREISMPELEIALKAVFGSDTTPYDALDSLGATSVGDRLLALYTETGISYFKPCRLITDRPDARI